MFFFQKPSSEAIQRFLAQQKNCEFTYSAIGGTEKTPPAGFVVDHTRVRLGTGHAVFDEATAVLRGWGQFQLGWVESSSCDIPLEQEQMVAVLARIFGVWCLNACKIISVIDVATNECQRFGFMYGTLPGHVECGEERFLIEWDRSDDSVWYDILAFSRPQHLLARLGYPIVRRLQKKFARDSASAMQRKVWRAASASGKMRQ
ncbi:MAG: DUF1990 domain-containing protein [Planctomycetaceae bacterium]